MFDVAAQIAISSSFSIFLTRKDLCWPASIETTVHLTAESLVIDALGVLFSLNKFVPFIMYLKQSNGTKE